MDSRLSSRDFLCLPSSNANGLISKDASKSSKAAANSPGPYRVTRIFLEIDFLVNMWKKLWKWLKLSKNVKIYAVKYNLLYFY